MFKKNLSKKVICFTITFFALLSINTAFAQHNIGDVVTHTVDTDIITYVNNNPIPSYSVDGETLVRLEDLQYYGFDVSFSNNIASAAYDKNKTIDPISRNETAGLPVLYSDITVQINGITVPGYNIEGYMAVPVERTCSAYLPENAKAMHSPYSLNYIWNSYENALYIDISDDRISYQDFMIDLLNTAHMGLNSEYYNSYIKAVCDNINYNEIFADIKGTRLEEYMPVLCGSYLVDYPEGAKNITLSPYRGATRTDAVFLAARILGSGIEYYGFSEEINYKEDMPYIDAVLPVNDWAGVDEWAKPYVTYAVMNNILAPDSNNNISSRSLLTHTEAKQIISNIMTEMESGISNKKLECILDPLGSHELKTHLTEKPILIKDNILYVSIYDLAFDTTLKRIYPSVINEMMNIDCPRETSYMFYAGYYGDVIYMPGISVHINSHTNYFPYPIRLMAPARLLYGEIMVPVADLKDENYVYDEARIYAISTPIFEHRVDGIKNGYQIIIREDRKGMWG